MAAEDDEFEEEDAVDDGVAMAQEILKSKPEVPRKKRGRPSKKGKGRETYPCPIEGCAYVGKTQFALKMHIMRKHPEVADEVEVEEEPMDLRSKFKACAIKCGITSKLGAITDLFFRGNIEDPAHLIKILKTAHADPASIKLLVWMWFGKEYDINEVIKSDAEDKKDDRDDTDEEGDDVDVDDELDKEIARLKKLAKLAEYKKLIKEMSKAEKEEDEQEKIPYEYNGVMMRLTPQEVLAFEKLKAEREKKEADRPKEEERKMRVLDDGSTVKMTDEEWAEYTLRKSMLERVPPKKDDDVRLLLKEQEEKYEKLMKEMEDRYSSIIGGLQNAIKQMQEDQRIAQLEEKIDLIRKGMMSGSDLDKYLETKRKLEETGMEGSKNTDIQGEIEKMKVEKGLEMVTQELKSLNKKTDAAVSALADVVKSSVKKQTQEEVGKPPVQDEYEIEEIPEEEVGE